MNTHQTLRQTLLALSCAAWLFSAVAHAQQSTPAPGGGTSIRDILGLPPVGGGGGGGGMCMAPLGGATCGGAGPASQGNTSGVNTGGGNPINLTNGNKYQMEVDLPALPGELGIEIVRHYNSAHRHVVGQLGMGWRLSYETDLYVVGQTVQILQADGARLVFNIDPKNPSLCSGADPAQGWVQILTSARGVKSYVWHWTHGENAGRQLRFDEGGKLVQIAAASGAVLSITRGPKGELLKVTDPQGRSLSFNHGGPGRVRQAEQAQQQQQQASSARNNATNATTQGTGGLVGSAPGLAVFTGIQSIDTPVGRFGYEHGVSASGAASAASSAQAQALARAQAANLTQVSLPTHTDTTQAAHAFANRPLSSSSVQRRYHYEDARHPMALTGVSVLGSGSDGQVIDQRLSTFLYNERGQASLSVRGEPARLQTDAGTGQPLVPARLVSGTGVQQVHVQIVRPALQSSNPNTPPGQTLLTNSLGQQTLYTHQIIGGQYRLVQALGAGCAQCGPVNQRWGYDSLGRLIEQTSLSPVAVQDGQPQGSPQPLLSTRHTLDAQGRTQRIEQVAYVGGKAQTPQLVERHEYLDARWPDKPTLIARPSVVAGLEQQIALTYNDAGQVTQLFETGYSPLDVNGKLVGGQPASTPAQASRLERATLYTHTRINGRSLLTQIDGPLPNGPSSSPTDSDITRLQWDEKGSFLVGMTQPMGLTQRFEHDTAGLNPSGRLLALTDVLGVRTELGWSPRQTTPDRILRAGLQIDVLRDPLGRPTRTTRNDGASISAAYDDALGTVRHTLPDGEVRETRRDAEARPIASQWLGQGGQVLVGGPQIDWGTPNAQGLNEIRITEASGVLTTLRQNPLQAISQSQRGQGAGQLQQTERFDAAQHLLSVQRNEALTQVRDTGPGNPANATTASATDLHTSRSLTLPNGAQHRQWLDDFGRVVRLQHPETGIHRAAYDAADRQTDRWDSSRHSSARYDALGRLIQLRHANTDGASVQTASAVVKAIAEAVLSAEEETTWTYAGALLVRQTSTAQDKHFAFDANGRLIEERLSLRRQNAAQTTTAAAATTATADWLPELTTRYQRDAFGRIQQVTLPEGAVLTQRYNAQGRIEALALQEPASRWWHTAIRWVWAEHGTKDLITGIEHSSSRGLRGYQHANGSTVSSAHDTAGRLTQWSDGPISTALGFNENAQLASLKTQAPERPGPTQAAAQTLKSREQSLVYDPFGRLRQVGEGQDVQQAFDFDANGNRTAQSRRGQGSATLDQLRFVLAPNSDRLLSVQDSQGNLRPNTRRYEYNAAGEPIRIDSPTGQTTLHYNAIGQIGAVEQDGQLLAHYAYNGARQRVAKTVNQGGQQETTYFTWHAGLLDAELDSQGRVERRVIYFNLRPVALLQYGHDTDTTHTTPDSAQRLAIHGDHLGTPQAITDERQRVVWLAQYDAFGRATAQGLPSSEVTAQNRSNRSTERSWIGSAHAANAASAPADKPFEFHLRFAGQYEDRETGWHYNWHRFYDPDTGRYLTPDPIGLRGGDNAFGYAGGDPFAFLDPWGLYSVSANGTTTFHTEFADLPTFSIDTLQGWQDYSRQISIPTPPGLPDVTIRNPRYHQYNQQVAVTDLRGDELGRLGTYLMDNPTPNSGAFPATFGGTYNPATPDRGPFSGFVANQASPDDVVSFLRTGLSGRTYVVNVTTNNHSLRYGIVIRGVRCQNGRAIFDNYGEGAGIAQALGPVSNYLINDIWYWATETALEEVTGRRYSVNGRDWNENNQR